eukprot:18606-Heterococcus_DN1.PRE.3
MVLVLLDSVCMSCNADSRAERATDICNASRLQVPFCQLKRFYCVAYHVKGSCYDVCHADQLTARDVMLWLPVLMHKFAKGGAVLSGLSPVDIISTRPAELRHCSSTRQNASVAGVYRPQWLDALRQQCTSFWSVQLRATCAWRICRYSAVALYAYKMLYSNLTSCSRRFYTVADNVTNAAASSEGQLSVLLTITAAGAYLAVLEGLLHDATAMH